MQDRKEARPLKSSDMRKQSVLRMLRTSNKLTVEEAMQAFGVSESTVRRLFAQLEADGEVIRAYGGICCAGRADDDRNYFFERVKLENPREKAAIGKSALPLIKSGDVIYLDSGTTVMSLGAAMADVFRDAAAEDATEKIKAYAELLSSCTIFTHSLVNLELLKGHMKVILLGGEYRDAQRDFCGYLTERAISSLRFSKCFIGVDGYSADDGLLAGDFSTAGINRLVTQNSSYRVLLADSSKYRRPSGVSYAPLSEVDCIVTDAGLGSEACDSLGSAGIKVVIAAQ